MNDFVISLRSSSSCAHHIFINFVVNMLLPLGKIDAFTLLVNYNSLFLKSVRDFELLLVYAHFRMLCEC